MKLKEAALKVAETHGKEVAIKGIRALANSIRTLAVMVEPDEIEISASLCLIAMDLKEAYDAVVSLDDKVSKNSVQTSKSSEGCCRST